MSVSTTPEKLITIGLYVHGLHLDPEVITKLLGQIPTHSWKSGDKVTTANGRLLTKKLGLWCVKREFYGANLNDALEQFLSSLSGNTKQIGVTQGVDSISIDLFHSETRSNCYPEIVISPENLVRIAALGIPLHITIFADSMFDPVAEGLK